MQTDTDRPIQDAERMMFQILGELAPHVPIVIIGTKKDRYLGLQENIARGDLERNSEDLPNIGRKSKEMAQDMFEQQQRDIQKTFDDIEGFQTHFVETANVSRGMYLTCVHRSPHISPTDLILWYCCRLHGLKKDKPAGALSYTNMCIPTLWNASC